MLNGLIEKIKERKPKRVLVQLPEGLVINAQAIQDKLSSEGIEAFISLEPCYGSCDLRDCEAERLHCDLLVNIGHSDFGLRSKVPVLYYEWRFDFNPIPLLEKNFEKIERFGKIGLVSTVNYLDSLEDAKKWLGSRGKKCYTERGSVAKYPGQILGCDISAGKRIEEKVDCFLFIGSGKFHPIGLDLEVSKPVFQLDPEKGEIIKVDSEKFLKQREVAKALAKECKSFGIIVSTKPGQLKINEALKIKETLEEKGKKCYIFTMDRITPEKLEGIKVDCFINMACPRLALDNRTLFRSPVINPNELDIQ